MDPLDRATSSFLIMHVATFVFLLAVLAVMLAILWF
jgi:hypothetical protein